MYIESKLAGLVDETWEASQLSKATKMTRESKTPNITYLKAAIAVAKRRNISRYTPGVEGWVGQRLRLLSVVGTVELSFEVVVLVDRMIDSLGYRCMMSSRLILKNAIDHWQTHSPCTPFTLYSLTLHPAHTSPSHPTPRTHHWHSNVSSHTPPSPPATQTPSSRQRNCSTNS